jgi:hypothetical protein
MADGVVSRGRDPEHMKRKSSNERAKKWRARSKDMFKKQNSFLSLWQAQAEIFYPERADFTIKHSDAMERYEGLHTGEPQYLRRELGNKIGALLRPRGRDWFNLATNPEENGEEDDARKWLERMTKRHKNIVYDKDAMFVRCMKESDHDYVTFGNSIVSHTYNSTYSGMLYKCLHLRNNAWKQDYSGKVNENHENMILTLSEMARMFGKDALPKKLKERLDKHPHEYHTIIRCVAPLSEYETDADADIDALAQDGFEFCSLYMTQDDYDHQDNPVLAEGHFRWFPYTHRRWMTVSGEDYGRSAVTGIALANGRTLNVAEEALLTGIELAVEPPKVVAHDSMLSNFSFRAGEVAILDDDYDYRRHGDAVQSIKVGEVRYAMEFKTAELQFLGRVFYENLLKLPVEHEMTASEAGMRTDQMIQEGAPVFEPMEEDQASIMDATFNRAMAKGAYGRILPDGSIEGLPRSLEGVKTEFNFDTPISRALKQRKSQQFDELMVRVAGLAQLAPVYPEAMEVLSNVDLDEAMRDAVIGSAPATWLRNKKDVEAIREERHREQAVAQQQAAAMQMAETAAKANPENMKMLDKAMQEGQQ